MKYKIANPHQVHFARVFKDAWVDCVKMPTFVSASSGPEYVQSIDMPSTKRSLHHHCHFQAMPSLLTRKLVL